MKKLIYLCILLVALTGCSIENNVEDHAEENKATETEQPQQTEQAEQTEEAEQKVKKDVYVPNPQITDDRELVKIGETVSDSKGKLTLKNYKKVDQTVNVGPIEMVIKDVKVMHFVPDYSMIDFFHGYTHDEEFDFVKVGVEVKNTSKEQIKYTPIAALKMNSGEHKTWEDDIYLEELTGEIGANEVKKGNTGFILSKTEDIESIELLTSDAVDKQNKVIEQGKHINIEF